MLAEGALRASLPQLDGTIRAPGLAASVRIARDALGVPTLEAGNRLDLAFATGFVHAQDRYFQMDLARRLAAGELAELFGPVALAEDEKTRLFRFRSVARQVLAAAGSAQRALLESYARGVNAGLASLGSRPWEYWVVRAVPAPWRAEDSLLVAYAMWWDLQADQWDQEIVRQEVNARLGGPECAGWKCALQFFYPARTGWDAPDGEEPAEPPGAVPPPEVLDVRGAARTVSHSPAAGAWSGAAAGWGSAGSNNWAIAGRLTATGAALIANDMHLSQRVPAVWYRARLRTAGSAAEPALDLAGVTLPGTPLLIAGSNTHIAWGFTNSDGNWVSVTHAACSALTTRALVTPAGDIPLTVVREPIHVRGAPDTVLEVRSGPAGVLLADEPQHHDCWFVAWLAQLPQASNLDLLELERATSVAAALELAPQLGMPHQNLVVGDQAGHIGWTIAGRIPDSTDPQRALGKAAWTTSADQPSLADPPLGRIWSANARVTTDTHAGALIGGVDAPLGAHYDLGARARQIRDDLLALRAPVRPADMLRIQLDDRALFLARWRELLLRVLDPPARRDHPQREEFRRLVEAWDARADVGSVGYRLLRAWHQHTRDAVWAMLLGALRIPVEEERAAPPPQFEQPLWQLVTEQPLHLLAADYPDWHQFLLARVDATVADLGKRCRELARCTWGERNTVRIRHPLSGALPWLRGLLDMPAVELPGDHNMPRVQDHTFGASERFAVSPGHENEGYFHMPGGQSGHPLSPYYRAGFLAWARGEPLPFLPGAAQHTLTLTPE
ncbi:MAG TPA: penicillin acylase family protein [Steroidobacteraceae bacterium]|nr:penicillin acylase family protein [Steroidobacteraceae bacterium]